MGPQIFSRELGRAGGARAKKSGTPWGPIWAPPWGPMGPSSFFGFCPRFFFRLLAPVLFSAFGPDSFLIVGKILNLKGARRVI